MNNLKIQTDENQVIDWEASKESGDTIIFMDKPHVYEVGDWVEVTSAAKPEFGQKLKIGSVKNPELLFCGGKGYVIDEIKPCSPPKPAQSYEEVEDKSGYVLTSRGDVVAMNQGEDVYKGRVRYKTKQQALSAQAFAKLTHIYADWVGDYVPDWGDEYSIKCCVGRKGNKAIVACWVTSYHFLTFPTRDLAEQFLEYRRELINVWMMIGEGGE